MTNKGKFSIWSLLIALKLNYNTKIKLSHISVKHFCSTASNWQSQRVSHYFAIYQQTMLKIHKMSRNVPKKLVFEAYTSLSVTVKQFFLFLLMSWLPQNYLRFKFEFGITNFSLFGEIRKAAGLTAAPVL